MIEPNEGNIDRIVRVAVGVALLLPSVFPAVFQFSFPENLSWLRIVLMVAAFALILTGLTGFCGLYRVFGIATCPITKDKVKRET